MRTPWSFSRNQAALAWLGSGLGLGLELGFVLELGVGLGQGVIRAEEGARRAVWVGVEGGEGSERRLARGRPLLRVGPG